MAVLNFEIAGFTRLALRDIKSFKLKPVNKLQMILGTNGSGKSSLINELTAVASKPADFEKGGYKKITIKRKNHIYDCICDFSGPKNRFAISRDDLTLYDGHSSEAYNSIVSQELGETADIHSVRIGAKRFTTMDTDARRKWFTSLSPQDFSYAIGYYKRLSENTRDIQGAINRVNTKLMQEKAKLIDEATQAVLNNEIQDLIKQKQEMMQYWRPQADSFESIMQKLKTLDDSLVKQSEQLGQTLKVFNNHDNYKDTSQMWEKLSQLKSQEAVLNSEISNIYEELETNTTTLTQAKLAGVKDIQQIIAELAELSRKIASIPYRKELSSSPEKALTAYDSIYSSISVIMDELTPDPDLLYTKESFLAKKQQHEQLFQSLHHIERTITALSEKKSVMLHQKEQNHTKCPKCEHVWSRGYNEDIFNDICSKLDTNNQAKDQTTAQMQELYTFMETAGRQIALLDRLGYLASGCPDLDPIWSELIVKKLVRINPGQALERFKLYRAELLDAIEYNKLDEQIKDLNITKNTAEKMAGVNEQELIQKNQVLELTLYNKQLIARQTSRYIEGLKKAIDAMEYQNTFMTKAQDALMLRDQLIFQAEVANQHAAINEIVMSLDGLIFSKQKLLNQIDTQKSIIESLENEVKDYTVKAAAMKAAMLSLSPSTGLIAKGLTGYINHFIAKMNLIIQKVWLYPLEISPICMDDDKLTLDYKFAYKVNEKPAGKDISQGSGAQKEIFDLAFMIVSMIQLGMHDTEVFLDEFSIKMDYAHRKEAMKMVMDLLNSSDFTQIFMISHYESSYSSIHNADITVLCPENIHLPSDLMYNTASEINH